MPRNAYPAYYTDCMTTKELLHDLVNELDEQGAQETLALLLTRQRASQENIPSFAGLITSGSQNLSHNAEKILREEMGRFA